MLDRAARLARLGTRLVSALAGLLMLALLAFGGFALWQDAALRRGRLWARSFCSISPPHRLPTTQRWPSCKPSTPTSAAG